MPQDIYSLGRSVGLSAWEIYVRQSLLLNPDIEPLSEREWLAEQIGIGTSMLLKISKDNTNGVHTREFPMPANSLLCAPNTIIGSFFYGEADTIEDSNWCKRVTDYGVGIANSTSKNPGDGDKTAHSLPNQDSDTPSELTKRRMLQYIRIQDAVFLQDGIWADSGTSAPAKTLEAPDITKPSTLRITFQDKVTEDFFVLFTGFVNRAILKGESGIEGGSVMPDDPGEAAAFRVQDGDYLGPRLFPWANKVVFTYPGILSYLLRENIVSQSPNLKIVHDKDQVETLVDISRIQAGPGVQVNDPSKDSDRARVITISSRIQVVDGNTYIKVEEQTAENTKGGEGDSSKVPTHLKGSVAVPGAGVAITQPRNPGDDHIISSIITVGRSEGGYSDKYMQVTQSAKDDATKSTTTLLPSYAMPDAGVGISQPAIPGGPFTIGAKIAVQGSGAKYIAVSQDKRNNSSEIATILTPAQPTCGRGIGITAPRNAGEDYVIGAIIHSAGRGANYLNVSQPVEQRTADEQATELHPSKITPAEGIAITQPSTAGQDIKISSKMKTSGSAANYIAIAQSAHDAEGSDARGANQFSTILTPSKIVGGKRVSVSQPNSAGGNITINNMIDFEPGDGIGITDLVFGGDDVGGTGKVQISSIIGITGAGALGLKVTQTRGGVATPTTTLQPSHLVVDERNKAGTDANGNEVGDVLTITYPSASGGEIKWYIDVDEIIRRMMKSGPLKNFMDDLLNKIFKGGEVLEDGHIKWPEGTEDIKIPLCDLNIYSKDGEGETFTDALRSRTGNTSNDLRMK